MLLRRLFGREQAPEQPKPPQQPQLGQSDATVHLDPFGLQMLQNGFAARQEEMVSGSPDFSPDQMR